MYGEELVTEADVEYRHWDPWRSKLAAYLVNGADRLPFDRPECILYLGGAHGTTVSHLSDLLPETPIFAVEKSPIAFAVLLALARRRSNVLPLLADAQLPERYLGDVGTVGFLYQDVALRNQAGVFVENVAACLRSGGTGLLMLKVRSVTQRRSIAAVTGESREILSGHGLRIVDQRALGPFSRDHVALAVTR